MSTEPKYVELELKVIKLEKELTDWKQSEKALWKRVYELGEFIKDLNCLYAISVIGEQCNMSLDETIQGVVSLIPSAFEYPEMTCARVILENHEFRLERQEFRTENFRETTLKEDQVLTVEGACVGSIEVCLLEGRAGQSADSYIREKRRLINAVAERLGSIVGQWRAEQLTACCLDHPGNLLC